MTPEERALQITGPCAFMPDSRDEVECVACEYGDEIAQALRKCRTDALGEVAVIAETHTGPKGQLTNYWQGWRASATSILTDINKLKEEQNMTPEEQAEQQERSKESNLQNLDQAVRSLVDDTEPRIVILGPGHDIGPIEVNTELLLEFLRKQVARDTTGLAA